MLDDQNCLQWENVRLADGSRIASTECTRASTRDSTYCLCDLPRTISLPGVYTGIQVCQVVDLYQFNIQVDNARSMYGPGTKTCFMARIKQFRPEDPCRPFGLGTVYKGTHLEQRELFIPCELLRGPLYYKKHSPGSETRLFKLQEFLKPYKHSNRIPEQVMLAQ